MKWYTIRAKAGAKSAEVLIYGAIGDSWFEESITARQFVKDLKALGDVEAISVRLNSPGGSVPDGLVIFNTLDQHAAKVTVHIDGVAASIASLIALAGDEIVMAENARMMIHGPRALLGGTAKQHRAAADMIDGFAASMAVSYARKSGKTQDAILALLSDDTDHWYSAEEAVAEGFATRVSEPLAVVASLDSAFYSRPLPVIARRSHEDPSTMTEEERAAKAKAEAEARAQELATAGVQASVNSAVQAALLADGTRRRDIAARFKAFADYDGVPDLMTTCQNDVDCSVETAATKLLAHLGSGVKPIGRGYVVTLHDEADKQRDGMVAALEMRAELRAHDSANPFRTFSLMEMARASLLRAGLREVPGDRMGLVAAAFTHTSSDFPKILENIANKSMLKGYEAIEETFSRWTAKGTLPDFKQAKRVDLNMFPSLLSVPEGAEFQYASIGERGESIILGTYGRLFSITRQAILNDDLNAFSRVSGKMGRAAKRTIGDAVYAVITGNPTMSDGQPLFDAAAHKNDLAAANINTDSIGAMRTVMALQRDPDGLAALGIRLATLLVPMALEDRATLVRKSSFYIGPTEMSATVPNTAGGGFDVVAEPRLDIADANGWYGVASSAMHDTVEVAYLDGVETPFLDRREGWHVDGVEMKVRIDFGVKALDFRGLARNAGA
jgi:ATP-dependent protease ClpP protease subunit